jgi:hypothetical protein
LNQALAKIKEAETNGAIAELETIMREKRIKQQEIIEGISEKMSETAKKKIIEEKQKQWTAFLLGIKEKFPEAAQGPTEAKNLPAQLLLNCPTPAIPSPESCPRKWLISSVQDCPYFHCPSVGKVQAPPLPTEPLKQIQLEKSIESISAPKPVPAPTPTPALTSPKPSILSEPIPTEIRYFACPDGVKVESGKCYGAGERSQIIPLIINLWKRANH